VLVQLILLDRLGKTTDITLSIWPYQLVEQFVLSLSVITVCIPYIRNALMGIESGMFQTGDFHLRRRGGAKISEPGQRLSHDSKHNLARESGGFHSNRMDGDRQVYTGDDPEDDHASRGRNTTRAEATTPVEHWDDESQSSQPQVIRTTREWIVDRDDHGRPGTVWMLTSNVGVVFSANRRIIATKASLDIDL